MKGILAAGRHGGRLPRVPAGLIDAEEAPRSTASFAKSFSHRPHHVFRSMSKPVKVIFIPCDSTVVPFSRTNLVSESSPDRYSTGEM